LNQQTGGVGDTSTPAANTIPDSTCPPNDPCKGLRDQLRKHEQKLRDYQANPNAHDNLGILGQGYDQ
jgi:hypothetical protein